MDKDNSSSPDGVISEMKELKDLIQNCGEAPIISIKSNLIIKCINTSEEIQVPELSEFLTKADLVEAKSSCFKNSELSSLLNSNVAQRLVASFPDKPKLTDFIPKEGVRFEPTGPSSAKNRLRGSLEFFDNCKLRYETSSPRISFEIKTGLAFMPDPKALWKDVPCPDDLVFSKENNVSDYIRASFGKTVIGASRRGRSHAHAGKPRDDDFAIGKNMGPWTLMAVCDGAGSAQYSRKGSEIACRLLADICRQEISDEKCPLTNITSEITEPSES